MIDIGRAFMHDGLDLSFVAWWTSRMPKELAGQRKEERAGIIYREIK